MNALETITRRHAAKPQPLLHSLLRIRLLYRLLAVALLVMTGSSTGAQAALPEGPQTGLARDRVTVETAAGGRHVFSVELALTPQQQERGMMFRESMDDDAGMLFVYDVEQPLSFWMNNTFIPLDILYIDARGRIVSIQHGKPKDRTLLPSAGPALGVLEIRGGLAALLGIRPGDRIVHPAFGVPRPR
jgi:uncharacterized protein